MQRISAITAFFLGPTSSDGLSLNGALRASAPSSSLLPRPELPVQVVGEAEGDLSFRKRQHLPGGASVQLPPNATQYPRNLVKSVKETLGLVGEDVSCDYFSGAAVEAAGGAVEHSSLDACLSICKHTHTCNYISFDRNTGWCDLYEICGTPVSSADVHDNISGWVTYAFRFTSFSSGGQDHAIQHLFDGTSCNISRWDPDVPAVARHPRDGRINGKSSSAGGPCFFMEAGAFDGETGSNTLFYELNGWQGLLVEPDPDNFYDLQQKNRQAYLFQGAVSPTHKIEFPHMQANGSHTHIVMSGGTDTVVAYPAVEFLSEIGQTTVDLWSIGVESWEGLVLNQTDFTHVEYGVILVDAGHEDAIARGIAYVMDREGFVDLGPQDAAGNYTASYTVYANPAYYQTRGLQVPGVLIV